MTSEEAFVEERLAGEAELASALLAVPEGRIFCGLLLEETGFLRNSARDSPSAEATYFREGERNAGQRVFEFLWRRGGAAPLECMAEYGAWLAEIRERALRQSHEAGGADAGSLSEDVFLGKEAGGDGC